MRPQGPANLAALKRYLADGGTITLTDATGLPAHKFLGVTRRAVEMRPTSSVAILNPGASRLDFGHAEAWTFDPEASTATLSDDPEEDWGTVLTYRLGDRQLERQER